MATFIVKLKKHKFMEVKVLADTEEEARLKVENEDYDPLDSEEVPNGGWEIVSIREADEDEAPP